MRWWTALTQQAEDVWHQLVYQWELATAGAQDMQWVDTLNFFWDSLPDGEKLTIKEKRQIAASLKHLVRQQSVDLYHKQLGQQQAIMQRQAMIAQQHLEQLASRRMEQMMTMSAIAREQSSLLPWESGLLATLSLPPSPHQQQHQEPIEATSMSYATTSLHGTCLHVSGAQQQQQPRQQPTTHSLNKHSAVVIDMPPDHFSFQALPTVPSAPSWAHGTVSVQTSSRAAGSLGCRRGGLGPDLLQAQDSLAVPLLQGVDMEEVAWWHEEEGKQGLQEGLAVYRDGVAGCKHEDVIDTALDGTGTRGAHTGIHFGIHSFHSDSGALDTVEGAQPLLHRFLGGQETQDPPAASVHLAAASDHKTCVLPRLNLHPQHSMSSSSSSASSDYCVLLQQAQRRPPQPQQHTLVEQRPGVPGDGRCSCETTVLDVDTPRTENQHTTVHTGCVQAYSCNSSSVVQQGLVSV